MKAKRVSILIALAGSTLWSCREDVRVLESGTPLPPMPESAYAYVAHDASGAPLVHGWLTLDLSNPESVSGEWHFRAVPGATPPMLMDGDYRLEGSIREGTLYFDTRPDYRDLNFDHATRFEGDPIRGTWTLIGIAGPLANGTFELTPPPSP